MAQCPEHIEYAKENNAILRGFWDWARKNSIWLLHYCTGCGAIELPPTMTSRYDMTRFGIAPMATPRQADVLLITGYLSLKTLKRVIWSYELMQAPKYVIGFGSCTINGGHYWDSYITINRLSDYIPVDIYIAGCMPRPEAVLKGILEIKERIRKRLPGGWIDYAERYEWYKANQRKILADV